MDEKSVISLMFRIVHRFRNLRKSPKGDGSPGSGFGNCADRSVKDSTGTLKKVELRVVEGVPVSNLKVKNLL